MKKKKTGTIIISFLLTLILVGIGVYLFIIDSQRRSIKLSQLNVHLVVSETEWTNNAFEIKIKYDGDANRDIKGYSFDGGTTWSKVNIYTVEKNEIIDVAVKDINDKIYDIQYEVKNIDKEGPKIEVADNIQVSKGTKVNLSDYVIVTDSGSGLRDDVVFTPSSVDTSKLGSYDIQIYAIDKLANKTISKMTVNVLEKAPEVEPTKISLSNAELELSVGEENVIVATLEPKYVTNKTIIWRTSDDKVVTVDVGGKIKAVGTGKATIRAVASNGYYEECEITVK